MSTETPEAYSVRVSTTSDVASSVIALGTHPLLRGASDIDRALVSTMVSELGTNIVKYARRGTISVVRREHKEGIDIEIVAEDNGPGIDNIERATSDHFSTGGTLGLGLPSVRRMADEFSLTSSPGEGTRVRAVKRIFHLRSPSSSGFPAAREPAGATRAGRSASVQSGRVDGEVFDLATRSRQRDGEVVSGDRALSLICDGGLLLGIVDASGHGNSAHMVATRLEACFLMEGSSDIERMMRRFDETMRGTIGAAAGLAFVEADRGQFRYAGVGNTRAAQVGALSWRGISRDGVLGGRPVQVNVQSGQLAPRDVLMLWTDGLPESGRNSRSAVTPYRSATEIAAVAITDFARGYDDAACIVLRWRP
jgi:anti-sigma regulatory factor (Ser/Thr protein kinase)